MRATFFVASVLLLLTGVGSFHLPLRRPPSHARAAINLAGKKDKRPPARGFGGPPPPTPEPPQQKEKSKKDRFELQFTCNMCDFRNTHSISRHAYTKGTVIVTCPSCNATHLVADNLNWIEDDFSNLEEYMEKQGTPITKIADGNAAAEAAVEAAAKAGVEADAEEVAAPAPAKPIDGISDEQAMRIREAVKANKQRKRMEKREGATE